MGSLGVEEVITLSDWIHVREDKTSTVRTASTNQLTALDAQLFELVDSVSNSSAGTAESDFEASLSGGRNIADPPLPRTSVDDLVPISKVAFLSHGCNSTNCSELTQSLSQISAILSPT